MCALVIPILSSEFRTKVINFSGGGAATHFLYSAYATSKVAKKRVLQKTYQLSLKKME